MTYLFTAVVAVVALNISPAADWFHPFTMAKISGGILAYLTFRCSQYLGWLSM